MKDTVKKILYLKAWNNNRYNQMNYYDFSELNFFFNKSGLFGQEKRFEKIFEYLDQNINILHLPYMTNINIISHKVGSHFMMSPHKLYVFYLILKFHSQNSEHQKELLEKFEFVENLDIFRDAEKIHDMMNDDIIIEFMRVEEEETGKYFIGLCGYNLESLDKRIQKFVLKMENMKMIYRLTYFISFGKDYQEKDFKKDFLTRYKNDFLVAVNIFDCRSDPEYILNLILTMNYYKKLFFDYINKNYLDKLSLIYDINNDLLNIKEYGISKEQNQKQISREYIQINQIFEKEISILNYISFVYFLKSEVSVFLRINHSKIDTLILEDFIKFCSEYIDKFPSQEIVTELIFFKQNIQLNSS